ncbi:repetitive organellar protein-like [Centruroides vittatus]|uniref:repetitive organellar protein-like n=1 Tax=Centruroides vittatus TaxID=120091 RepID=UPI00351041C9
MIEKVATALLSLLLLEELDEESEASEEEMESEEETNEVENPPPIVNNASNNDSSNSRVNPDKIYVRILPKPSGETGDKTDNIKLISSPEIIPPIPISQIKREVEEVILPSNDEHLISNQVPQDSSAATSVQTTTVPKVSIVTSIQNSQIPIITSVNNRHVPHVSMISFQKVPDISPQVPIITSVQCEQSSQLPMITSVQSGDIDDLINNDYKIKKKEELKSTVQSVTEVKRKRTLSDSSDISFFEEYYKAKLEALEREHNSKLNAIKAEHELKVKFLKEEHEFKLGYLKLKQECEVLKKLKLNHN